jgi:AraC-like DNA-binding protein
LTFTKAVSACPKHGIKLVEKCGCRFEQKQNIVNIKRVPGVCSFCGNKLSINASIDIENAEKHEVYRAQLVAEFLVDRKLVVDTKRRTEFGFAVFLRNLINTHTNGNASKFGKMLLISKSKLSEWLKGAYFPVFPQVVDIAQACNCSIADIYFSNHQNIQKISPLYHSYRRIISSSNRSEKLWRNVTESRLKSFLINEDPISLKQAATELNVSTKYLKKHFGDISTKIVNNYHEKLIKDAELRLIERCKEYRKTAETLFKRGIKPTCRKVMKEFKINMPIIKERKLCQSIINEVIQAASISSSTTTAPTL